jgi:hypothetical protein
MTNLTQEEKVVSLVYLLGENGTVEPSGESNPDSVYLKVNAYLKDYQRVTIDLSGTTSMSPSFAYLAFGKLYDFYGDSLMDRIRFINDPLNFVNRVKQALERRSIVIKSEEKT